MLFRSQSAPSEARFTAVPLCCTALRAPLPPSFDLCVTSLHDRSDTVFLNGHSVSENSPLVELCSASPHPLTPGAIHASASQTSASQLNSPHLTYQHRAICPFTCSDGLCGHNLHSCFLFVSWLLPCYSQTTNSNTFIAWEHTCVDDRAKLLVRCISCSTETGT